EVVLSGGLRAVDPRPHLDGVQIDLHDPRLAPGGLDEDGEIGLQALADVGALRPEEDVLGGLLADGGAARMRFGRRLLFSIAFFIASSSKPRCSQKRASSAA